MKLLTISRAVVSEFRGEILALAFGAISLTAACGGGGGSTGSGGVIPSTPTPSPSVTPAPTYAVSGKIVHCDSTWLGVPPASPSPEPSAAPCNPGSGLSGATVTVGGVPSANLGGLPGGTPSSPTVSATTAPDGSFTVANVSAGAHVVQVSMPAGQTCNEGAYPNNVNATPVPASVGLADSGNYAVYHAQINVSASSSLPTIHLTSLSQDEWCWYQQAIIDRNAVLGSQAPTANPPIDEYAQEMARSESIYLSFPGNCNCLFPQFSSQYTANGGLWTYADGWVGVTSWESAEYEGISHPNNGPAATSPTDPNCTSWAVCAALTKPNGVYLGLGENPTYRTGFVFIGISH